MRGNFLIFTSIRHFSYFVFDILAILGTFYLGFYSRVQTSRGRNSESWKGWWTFWILNWSILVWKILIWNILSSSRIFGNNLPCLDAKYYHLFQFEHHLTLAFFSFPLSPSPSLPPSSSTTFFFFWWLSGLDVAILILLTAPRKNWLWLTMFIYLGLLLHSLLRGPLSLVRKLPPTLMWLTNSAAKLSLVSWLEKVLLNFYA